MHSAADPVGARHGSTGRSSTHAHHPHHTPKRNSNSSVLGMKSKASLLGLAASPSSGSARKLPAGDAKNDALGGDGVVITGVNPMLELEDLGPRDSEAEVDAATKFGGRSQAALTDVMRHMRQSYEKGLVHRPAKAIQVNVPVYQTVMVKRLRDDPNNPEVVVMDCTIIQRALFFDFDQIEREDVLQGESNMGMPFLIRVNDGNSSQLQLDIRKVVNLEVASDRPGLIAHCVTASAEIPVERTTIFARSPFNICALEVMLELTSFSAMIGGKKYELRPDLLAPIDDLRNFVSCRDFDSTLDAMHDFDIIDTSPSVCLQIDSKFDTKGQVKTVYAPKVKVTFYCCKDALQPFLSIFMPIMFCALGNYLNNTMSAEMFCEGQKWSSSCRRAKNGNLEADEIEMYDNHPDIAWAQIVPQHLANSLTLGLTLIFLLPTISKSESTSNTFEINQLIVFFLFAGLIMGTIPAMQPIRYVEYTKMRDWCSYASNCLMFGSLLIPTMNWMLYRGLIKALTPRCKTGEPFNFNGRPSSNSSKNKSSTAKWLHNVSGSTVDISNLTPVYSCRAPRQASSRPSGAAGGEELQGKSLTLNPDMNRMHGAEEPWCEVCVGNTLKWVLCGIRREDLENIDSFSDMCRIAFSKRQGAGDLLRHHDSGASLHAGKKRRRTSFGAKTTAKTTMSDGGDVVHDRGDL